MRRAMAAGGAKEYGASCLEHIGGRSDDNKAFFAMSNDRRSGKIRP